MNLKHSLSQRWILLALLAAGAGVFVIFVFLPGRRASGELQKQLLEKQEFILQAHDLAPVIEATAEELQAASEYAQDWRRVAPSEATLAATFGRITQNAQQAGLSVQRFDPQPVVRLAAVWQAPVVVVAEGDFQQAFEFLRLVESMPGSLWIQGLRMETTGKDDGRLRCEMTITVFADNRDFSE